jgi:hypothetical protein
MLGKGKYDDACTTARASTQARGILLVVIDGQYGHGFSAQVPPEVSALIPKLLREVADSIECDNAATMN